MIFNKSTSPTKLYTISAQKVNIIYFNSKYQIEHFRLYLRGKSWDSPFKEWELVNFDNEALENRSILKEKRLENELLTVLDEENFVLYRGDVKEGSSNKIWVFPGQFTRLVYLVDKIILFLSFPLQIIYKNKNFREYFLGNMSRKKLNSYYGWQMKNADEFLLNDLKIPFISISKLALFFLQMKIERV